MLVSNSVSLLASLVDSALDLLSTAIIWGAAVAAGSKEQPGKGRTRVSRDISRHSLRDDLATDGPLVSYGCQYPTGKKRFEPLGVLVFSEYRLSPLFEICRHRADFLRRPLSAGVFMIASFSQVLVESVQRLYQHDADSEVASLSLFGKA